MNITSIQEQKMAYRIRLALSEACDMSITQTEIERLSAARRVAVERKKCGSSRILTIMAAGQNSIFIEEGNLWFRRLILLLAMLLVGCGLLFGMYWQQQLKVDEFAAFDVAMLTDDLPPVAYADRGFEVFLRRAE